MTVGSASQRARERFERDISEHAMTVLREDGVYRHLRFARPRTWSHGFDLVTWPGFLAVTGDMGTYVFARIHDMFDFFGGGGVNAAYWAEKLRAPEEVRCFAPQALSDYIEDVSQEKALTLDDAQAAEMREALEQSGLLARIEDEHEARRALAEFNWRGWRFEAWDVDLREFTFQYLWVCHAIVWGIAQYRRAAQLAAST